MKSSFLFSACVALFASVSVTQAQIVISTGQGSNQVAGTIDPNWKIVASGIGTAASLGDPSLALSQVTALQKPADAFVTFRASSYFNPAPADAAWIWKEGKTTLQSDPVYEIMQFELTFDLTGLDAANAVLSGTWGVDNAGILELVQGNGSTTVLSTLTSAAGGTASNFQAPLASFGTIGLFAGINTLRLTAINAEGSTGNPAAVLVIGTVAGPDGGPIGVALAVPEPSTYGILGALLLAGMIAARRLTQRCS